MQLADLVLLAAAWALWMLAGLWYFVFHGLQVPSKVRWLPVSCLEDAVGNFLVCGHFCGMLARCAPQGNWPAWRKPWYLAWVAAFGWLSFLFFQASAPLHAALCGVLAFTMLTTCPAAAETTSGASGSHQADAPLGRSLLCLDAAALLLGVGQEAAGTSWQRSSAALATSMASVPLLMVALGLLCSTSETEILSSIPAVMLQLLSFGVSCVIREDFLTASALVLLFLVHAALYLPLPSNDPESNPFYNSFKRSVQRCVKFMAQPVSGFGDETG